MPSKKRSKKRRTSRGIDRVLSVMGKVVGMSVGMVSKSAQRTEDPFWVLIATMLSHRTKEDVTLAASRRLFEVAPTPRRLAGTPVKVIEKRIYPVGFYRTKARAVKDAAIQIVDEWDGAVPDSVSQLLQLRGVGRKTANMVVTRGYGEDRVCVDTHVHRVSNRLGLVATNTPQETEYALMEVLPRRYRIGCNRLFVTFGREICRPISPICSRCALERECPRVGVKRHR